MWKIARYAWFIVLWGFSAKFRTFSIFAETVSNYCKLLLDRRIKIGRGNQTSAIFWGRGNSNTQLCSKSIIFAHSNMSMEQSIVFPVEFYQGIPYFQKKFENGENGEKCVNSRARVFIIFDFRWGYSYGGLGIWSANPNPSSKLSQPAWYSDALGQFWIKIVA